jgi:hypothetical protein
MKPSTKAGGLDGYLPNVASGCVRSQGIKAMTTAYEDALQELKLTDRSDPLTEVVAPKIFECAQKGERDTDRLRDHALKAITG